MTAHRYTVTHNYWVMVGLEPEPEWQDLAQYDNLPAALAAADGLRLAHGLERVSIEEWRDGSGRTITHIPPLPFETGTETRDPFTKGERRI